MRRAAAGRPFFMCSRLLRCARQGSCDRAGRGGRSPGRARRHADCATGHWKAPCFASVSLGPAGLALAALRRSPAAPPAQPRRIDCPGPPVLYTRRAVGKRRRASAAAAASKARRSPSSRRAAPAAAARRYRRRPAGRPTARVDPAGAARTRQRCAAHPRDDELRREEERLAATAEGIQQRRARAPGQRAQLPEVPRPRRRLKRNIARKEADVAAIQARAVQAAAVTVRRRRAPRRAAPDFDGLDQLATMVASSAHRRALPAGQLGARERRRRVAPQRCCAAACSTGSPTRADLRDTLQALSPQRGRDAAASTPS